MLELGRALMTKPKLLIIDEFSTGLAPKIFKSLYELLYNINLEENVIATNTKIYLTASDEGIGMKATYYKIDDGPF